MCMWFGFNPAINFCHSSTLLTLSVCAGATSTSPKFYLFFFHGLKMCMWFGFNPAVNFCHFSTLSFCRCDINFTEVRSILVFTWCFMLSLTLLLEMSPTEGEGDILFLV